MAEFRIRLKKRDLVIIYILLALFSLQFLMIIFLLYFARLPVFVSFFIKGLKILSPILLGANALIITSTMLIKGKELIIQSWKAFFRELLRLTALTFLITFAFIITCAALGILLELLFKWLSHIPSVENTINTLRDWINRHFY